MTPVFIDTHFIVALTNPHDRHHAEALELSYALEGGPFVSTDAVLLEVGNGLARALKHAAVEIITRFRTAPNIEVVNVTPALFDAGFTLYRRFQDKQWGLVDCISFVVMRERGMADALTFDQHFTQAGFNALMRGPA